MKLCKSCGLVKSSTEFHKNKSRTDGLQYSCKACNISKVRAWQQKHPDQHKAHWVTQSFTRHGITAVRYQELLEAQGGVCAACGGDNLGKRLPIDHDHSCCPGAYSCGNCIRGLLCHGCNSALGHVNDSVTKLDQLKIYLEG